MAGHYMCDALFGKKPFESEKMRDPQSDTRMLVEQAKNKNIAAFHQLVSLSHHAVFKMVFYRVRSTMDAEDLTQEIFLRAYDQLPGLKSPDKFKSWLYSIALNKVRDFIRKQKFRSFFWSKPIDDEFTVPADIQKGAVDAENQMMKQLFWKKVGGILDRMSKMEREVFMLRFFDQLGIAEISTTLEKGESTIKTHLYRALKKFRQDPASVELKKELNS